jgi:hypothetical protein
MRDLIALEDYVASLGSGFRRLSIVSGLVFGLSMGAFCLLALWPKSGPAKALSIAMLGGVATGLAFGFMFPRNLKKKLQPVSGASSIYSRTDSPSCRTP